MPYTVSGKRNDEICSETRRSVASAVVLAIKWEEKGYQAVKIMNASGRVLNTKEAQQRLIYGLRL